MRVFIVHAHHEPGSFNGALTQAEMDKVAWCDALVLQFPLWWLGLPAILKGWIDRLFAVGRAYGAGRYFSCGVFAGKRAMLLADGGRTDECLFVDRRLRAARPDPLPDPPRHPGLRRLRRRRTVRGARPWRA